MDASQLLYESIAIVLIALAIVVLRLRHSDKLGLSKKKKIKKYLIQPGNLINYLYVVYQNKAT